MFSFGSAWVRIQSAAASSVSADVATRTYRTAIQAGTATSAAPTRNPDAIRTVPPDGPCVRATIQTTADAERHAGQGRNGRRNRSWTFGSRTSAPRYGTTYRS